MARTKGTRNLRNEFYIITNGKETECNYFKLLKAKQSPYDVKVLFQNEDPLGLVRFAKKYVAESNQVWVVFDVDNTYGEGVLHPAIVEAEKSGVKCAISNMAFEVWLISHFQKCNQELHANGHKRILDKYLNGIKTGLTYSKSDNDTLKKYFIPNYRVAMANCKIVYQERMKDFQRTHSLTARPKIWEWNSCSTVYKLVEALKLMI